MNCLLVVNCLLTNDSDELSGHSFVFHIKMSQSMSSAAIMIATLKGIMREKPFHVAVNNYSGTQILQKF